MASTRAGGAAHDRASCTDLQVCASHTPKLTLAVCIAYPPVSAYRLVGQKRAPAAARNLLEDLFSGSGRPASAKVAVVLIDEIDMLLSRDQDILYNLFGWPQQPGAKLAIIGIANTLDLPERLLPKIARCAHCTLC